MSDINLDLNSPRALSVAKALVTAALALRETKDDALIRAELDRISQPLGLTPEGAESLGLVLATLAKLTVTVAYSASAPAEQALSILVDSAVATKAEAKAAKQQSFAGGGAESLLETAFLALEEESWPDE